MIPQWTPSERVILHSAETGMPNISQIHLFSLTMVIVETSTQTSTGIHMTEVYSSEFFVWNNVAYVA